MSRKQHLVRLSPAQRAELTSLLRRTGASALTHRRARILLQADVAAPGPRLSDAAVAAATLVDPRTVARVRALFATAGFDAALGRRARTTHPARLLDGAGEARLAALACSAPPPGHAAWTLRLLAAHAVELDIVATISPETVRATLKKTISNRG